MSILEVFHKRLELLFKQFEDDATKEFAKLEQDIARARQDLEDEKKRMAEQHAIQDSQIKLDVGGTYYATSITTLTKYPDSMLGAMFSGRHAIKKNEEGRVFIDRDGEYFRYILNFLRDDEWKLPEDKEKLRCIEAEIDFFGLPGPKAKKEFFWNPQRKGKDIILDAARKKCVRVAPGVWHQIQTTESLCDGEHFEVLVEEMEIDIVIGVGPLDTSLDVGIFIGYAKNEGISYSAHNGIIFYGNDKTKSLGVTYGVGDRIKVARQDNVLYFYKNDKQVIDIPCEDKVWFPTVATTQGLTFSLV